LSENVEGGGGENILKQMTAGMLLIHSCMPLLFIITIPNYLNFAIFLMVNLLFLQHCTAALDVNTVFQFSKILLCLQDKPFSFSSRSHVCVPSVPHLVIYSERRKGPSLLRFARKQYHSQQNRLLLSCATAVMSLL
jgi:hypothetical protein